jgi:hypothetical protein
VAGSKGEGLAIAGDIVAALVQVVPYAGGPIGGLAQARTNHQQRRWNQFLVALAESWDAELTALVKRCSEERISELVQHGLRKAEESFRDSQVRLAGAIVAAACQLGGGADAEAQRIDRAHFLLEVASGLTLGEVEMLAWVVPLRSAAAGDMVFEAGGEHTIYMIEKTNERFGGVAEALLERLRSRGLVERIDVEEAPQTTTSPRAGGSVPPIVKLRSAPVWRATNFGRDMLQYLRQVGEEGTRTP